MGGGVKGRLASKDKRTFSKGLNGRAKKTFLGFPK